MFAAMLLSPLAGAGMWAIVSVVAKACRKRVQNGVLALLPSVLMVAAPTAALGIDALQPLHGGKGYLKQAGLHLAALADSDSVLLSDSPRVQHYSGLKSERIWPNGLRGSDLIAQARRSGASYLAITDRAVARAAPDMGEVLGEPFAFLIARFSQGDNKAGDAVSVYDLTREAKDRGDIDGPELAP